MLAFNIEELFDFTIVTMFGERFKFRVLLVILVFRISRLLDAAFETSVGDGSSFKLFETIEALRMFDAELVVDVTMVALGVRDNMLFAIDTPSVT